MKRKQNDASFKEFNALLHEIGAVKMASSFTKNDKHDWPYCEDPPTSGQWWWASKEEKLGMVAFRTKRLSDTVPEVNEELFDVEITHFSFTTDVPVEERERYRKLIMNILRMLHGLNRVVIAETA